MLATYVVDSVADAGPGTLRDAIDQANATVGVADEIVFDEALFSTPQAILLDSELATITDALAIVGPGEELLTLDGQHGRDRDPATSDGWGAIVVSYKSSGVQTPLSIRGMTISKFDGQEVVRSHGPVVVDSVVFSDNRGVAIACKNPLEVRNSTFLNNGSGISAYYDLLVDSSRFIGNGGRAIFTHAADSVITNSLFEANYGSEELIWSIWFNSTDNGSSSLVVAGCSFVNNDTSTVIYMDNDSDANLILDSTFSGNGGYGTILAYHDLTISHCTIVDSHTTSIYGDTIRKTDSAKVVIDHSIVAGTKYVSSSGVATPAWDLRGDFSLFNSVVGIGEVENIDAENGNHIGSLETPVDPHLAPLGYNGGWLPTHAPLPSSIVIDAGDPDYVAEPGETDQRGALYARVAGERIDIGAYEAQGPVTAAPGDFNGDGRFDAADYTIWRDSEGMTVAPLTAGDATGDGVVDETDRLLWATHYGALYVPKVEVNDLADDDDGDIYNGRTTLREAINYTNRTSWANTITFDPALSSGVIEVGATNSGRYYQIESELTIDASMLPEGITLDADGRTTGLHINAFHVNTDNNFDVTLVGLTIKNGVGPVALGGAIWSLMNGELTLIDCTLLDNISGRRSGNQVSGFGGAIYAEGPVTLIDTLIDGASSGSTFGATGGSGSAVYAVGDVSLVRSHIANVTAESGSGGAIVAAIYGNALAITTQTHAPSVSLVDSSISNAAGGGVVAHGTVTLTRSTVEGVSGVGVAATGTPIRPPAVIGDVTLVDSAVRGFSINDYGNYNYLGLPGGAGIAAYGNVSLVRSRVEGNTVVAVDLNPISTKGGGVYARGTVSLLDSVVEGNSAAYGAGIYAEGRVSGNYADLLAGTTVVSIVGSSVSDNTALRNGGALTSRGAILVEASSISGNAITTGFWSDSLRQAIVSIDSSPSLQTPVTFTDVVLANNSGPASPIAGLPSPSIVLAGYGTSPLNATLVRTHVIDNQMNGVIANSIIDSVISRNAGLGAVVYAEVLGSTISSNSDGGIRGGYGPNLKISDSIIRGNSSTYGLAYQDTGGVGGQFAAGVNHLNGTLVLERSTVVDNHLTYLPSSTVQSYAVAGGVSAANVVAIDSTIRDNTIEGFGVTGGGVAVFGNGDAKFYRSTVSGNRAIGESARGGGIYGADLVELVQSTVSGNSAEGVGAAGGGVYTARLSATHSTIAGNSADSLGGGAYATTGAILEGTIVAGNSAPDSGPDLYRIGTGTPSINYSLLGDVADSGVDAVTGIGNLLGVDPLLGPLQDNGGPTWTHALLAGSPAIDAGDPTRMVVPYNYSPGTGLPPVSFVGDFDQRGEGFPRVLDGGLGVSRIDIGAYEAETPPPIAFWLAPLAMNGGPTPTHAPLPASIVIDAGDPDYAAEPGETDQRGAPYARVAGERIDIGAYKAQGPVTAAAGDFNGDGRFDAADYTVWRDSVGTSVTPLTAGDGTGDGLVDETDLALWRGRYGDRYLAGMPVVNDLADDDDGDIFNGRTTLREAINFANENAWIDTITFDPSLSGGTIVPAPLYRFSSYQIANDLTIDASSLAEGLTIDWRSELDGVYYPGPGILLQVGVQPAIPEISIDVTLRGLTLLGGGGTATIDATSWGELTLEGVTIDKSLGSAVSNWGPVTLVDSVVSDSGSNSFFGPGAVQSQAAIYLLRSDVTDSRRGGVYLGNRSVSIPIPTGHAREVVLVDSRVEGVEGPLQESAAVAAVNGNVRLERSHVTGATRGGVVGDTIELIDSTVSGNHAVDGYAAAVVGGDVSLVDSEVSDNSAPYNGSPFGGPTGVGVVAEGSVSLVRSRVENNAITYEFDQSYGGGVYANGAVSLVDSYVRGNQARYGGGVYARGVPFNQAPLPEGEPAVSLLGSVVDGNTAWMNGAAILAGGSIEIVESSISDNEIVDEIYEENRAVVAVSNDGYGDGHTISVVDSVLAGNSGPENTSVVAMRSGVTAEVIGSHVIDNQMNGVEATRLIDSVVSRNAGFGAMIYQEVNGSTISANQGGGLVAIGNSSSPVFVVDSVIRGNTTQNAIYYVGAAGVTGGNLVLERTVVTDNHTTVVSGAASQTAGGVFTRNLTAVDSTIAGNSIIDARANPSAGDPVRGGGVRAETARFYGSTVSGNSVSGVGATGGGVGVTSVLYLQQTTVSGNEAIGEGAAGGGVWSQRLTATHSTIAANQATASGGGLYAQQRYTLDGVIITGNTAGVGPDIAVSGSAVTMEAMYSLVGDPTGSGIDATTGEGNLLGVDPLLGPLQDNGGPTWTHALLPNSPAIDAGDPTRTAVPSNDVPWPLPPPFLNIPGEDDQRGEGYPRVLDGGSGVLRIDIGAYEAETPPPIAFRLAPLAAEAAPTRVSQARDAALAEFDTSADLLLLEGPLALPSEVPASVAAPDKQDEDSAIDEAHEFGLRFGL